MDNRLNSIKFHQKDFDRLYSRLKREDRLIGFPLEEIENYHWNRGLFGDLIYSYFYRRFTTLLLGLLRVEGSQRILNIGCGLGFDEKNLAHLHPDLEIWSIDVSQEMISRAMENQCPSRLCLSLAEFLPFPNESFDRILAREVIEHVLSPDKMIREIGRCLKPDGLAVITTEFHSSLALTHLYSKWFYQRWAVLLGQRLPKPAYQDRPPSVKEIKTWAKSSNLILENTIWDGALYQLCTSPQFQKMFKSKIVSVAHFFSVLENSELPERFFCDQVKFVLRKSSSNERSGTDIYRMEYCCPLCHEKLEDLPEEKGKQCFFCRKIFPFTSDGILNLIAYDFKPSEKRERFREEPIEEEMKEKVFSRWIRKILFRSVHFLGHWIYLFSIVSLAIILSFYLRCFKLSEGNTRLILNDKLARYLQTKGEKT